MTTTARQTADGLWVVPRNRWDLVADRTAPQLPTVSVVIPHYRQQRQLDLVLAALSLQSYPSDRLQIVVADDGSPVRPHTRAYTGEHRPVVVTQDDRGFRAAAARNLGVLHSDGAVVCFLDADTVPEPDYVAAAVRLPAVLPDALVVGRRRHADLRNWDVARLHAWMSGTSDAPETLTEPQWLRDAYAGTRDLLDADHRSYRHVISAVMTCGRVLFDEVGGFDEGFVGYGGEDWELAHRAWGGGAVFAHAADAVAWHDGPDQAGRPSSGDGTSAKNAEALALSQRVTDRAARRHGVRYAVPEVAVEMCAANHTPASLLVSAGSFLSARDCAVWVAGDDAAALVDEIGADDTRLRVGAPPDDVRTRFVVRTHARSVIDAGALDRLIDRLDADGLGRVRVSDDDGLVLTVESVRASSRARRWAESLRMASDDLTDDLFGCADVRAGDTGVVRQKGQPRLDW